MGHRNDDERNHDENSDGRRRDVRKTERKQCQKNYTYRGKSRVIQLPWMGRARRVIRSRHESGYVVESIGGKDPCLVAVVLDETIFFELRDVSLIQRDIHALSFSFGHLRRFEIVFPRGDTSGKL